MTAASHNATPGTLREGLACVACGYDLRGLAANGRTLLDWLAQYSGPLAALAFYLRLAGVLRRFGKPAPAAQAVVVAVLMSIGALRTGGSPRGILRLLITLPSFQHGHPSMQAYLLRMLVPPWPDYEIWASALPAVVSLWGTYLVARLLWVALHARPVRPADAPA